MTDRSQIDTIKKDRACMKRALAEVGAVQKGNAWKCAFHDDGNASAGIHQTGDGTFLYTCKADCGWNAGKSSGDALAVLARGGKDFKSSVEFLGGNITTKTPASAVNRRASDSKYDERFARDCVARLQADEAALAELLRTRAVDKETAERFGVGITQDGIWWTFTIRDTAGKFVAVNGHRRSGDGPKSIWFTKGTKSAHLCPVVNDNPGPTWLCSGVFKALGVAAAGRNAIGFTCGEGADVPAEFWELVKGGIVAVAPDADKTGTEWLHKRVIPKCREHGIDLHVVDLGLSKEEGLKDIGDFITRQFANGHDKNAVGAILDERFIASESWQHEDDGCSDSDPGDGADNVPDELIERATDDDDDDDSNESSGDDKKKRKKSKTALQIAIAYIKEHTEKDGRGQLRWWREEHYQYTGTHYVRVPRSELVALVQRWMAIRGFDASPRKAKEVVDSIAAAVLIRHTIEAPSFLNENGVNAKNIVAFKNGLVDISNVGGAIQQYEHTPEWFSFSCLPFDFDPAAKCPQFEKFAFDVFDGDQERIRLLRQIFGLCLVQDTSYHKVFMLIGPRRAGKGVTLRILIHLLGNDLVACPTLASLIESFGLSQLLGKSVCVFSDAHLSGRTDAVRVVEVIKSISGEDSVGVNRKNREYLPNVKMGVRFIITANELMRFHDPSGALSGRMVVLPFNRSFAGHEDLNLENKLKTEASGIYNWSMAGLQDLRSTGRFVEASMAQEVKESYDRLASPISGFVDDFCETGLATLKVDTTDLYTAWVEWCRNNGHAPGSTATFGAHIKAAETNIKRRRAGEKEGRGYFYDGIALNAEGQKIVNAVKVARDCARDRAQRARDYGRDYAGQYDA